MKTLLLAVADHLRAALALPVYVCPEEALPPSAAMPCLSVADGGLSVRPLAGGRSEEELEAYVACHLEPQLSEAALTGAGGLLDLAAAARVALEGELLGLPGFLEARLVREEPSRRREFRGRPLLSRRLSFRYLREVP